MHEIEIHKEKTLSLFLS